MCTRAGPLSAAEIAVGGRGASLAGRHDVAVDSHAHRTAGVGPFKSGVAENTIKALAFRLPLHAGRTRRHKPGHFADPAGQNRGGSTQVLDARIGAGADENAINRDLGQLLARCDGHVIERVAQIFARTGSASRDGSGTQASIGRASSGVVPQVTMGAMALPSSVHLAVETRIRIGSKRRPRLDGSIESIPFGRVGTTFKIGESGCIRRDHSAAPSGLDRHVAQRHASFHGQCADSAPAEFDGMALRSVGADMRDDCESDVLSRRRRPWRYRPLRYACALAFSATRSASSERERPLTLRFQRHRRQRLHESTYGCRHRQ